MEDLRIFSNEAIDGEFKRKGFVVERIAQPSELDEILALYEQVGKQESPHNFYTTIWVGDASHRRKVTAAIEAFILPRIQDILQDYEPVFGNFMVKRAGEDSALGLHQDWTFLDEKQYRSVNCWLQVTPSAMDNGPLIVVPYSHYFTDIIRGRNITSPFDRIFPEIKDNYGLPILPKAGEAVFFDNSMMHGSDDNLSGTDRIAVSLVLKPKSAMQHHYFRMPDEEGTTYRVPVERDFYVDFGLFDDLEQLRSLPECETVELRQPPVSFDRFGLLHEYYRNEERKMDIFYDAAFNREFRQKGFVVIPNFLDSSEIAMLKQFYEEHPLPDATGFHATSHSRQPEYKRLVHDTITSVIGAKAQALVRGYRHLTSSYTVKEPDPNSFFEAHLDWNMVDEAKCISITLWCALMDTNEVNGNIYMLERSHTLGPTIRSGKGLYLHALNDNYKKVNFTKRILRMNAGDMVLYDHRVFHGSPANRSEKVRISFNHVMIPESVPSVHYSQESPGRVEMYEVDDDFYNRYEIGARPSDVKFIRSYAVERHPLDQGEVNKMIVE